MAKEYESRKNAQKLRATLKYTGYPNRRSFALFVAYCYTTRTKKADLVKRTMDDFLSKLPELRQKELLEIYNSLTPEQKKFPGRGNEDED